MQTCDVFQMVYQVAKRFYLLFQQHSNEERAQRDGLKVLGRDGFSQLVQLGPKVALALPDCRSNRSRTQVGRQGGSTSQLAQHLAGCPTAALC
jgi:hypothetical protein